MTLSLELPDELIEAVTQRAIERLQEAPERRFLSKEALALHLGVSERRLKSWRERGMPGRKVGRVVMFDPDEVAAWIDREGQT